MEYPSPDKGTTSLLPMFPSKKIDSGNLYLSSYPWAWCRYYASHFVNREMEAQEGSGGCSYSLSKAGDGPRSAVSSTCFGLLSLLGSCQHQEANKHIIINRCLDPLYYFNFLKFDFLSVCLWVLRLWCVQAVGKAHVSLILIAFCLKHILFNFFIFAWDHLLLNYLVPPISLPFGETAFSFF